jgi:hypothetical protein
VRALARRYGRAMVSPSGDPIVLLFDNRASAARAARLHVASCPMTRVAKRGSGVGLDPNVSEEDIADLNERGFPVKRCKCIR